MSRFFDVAAKTAFVVASTFCTSASAMSSGTATQGYLIDLKPVAISASVISGDTSGMSLTFTFNNVGANTFGYLVYVSDDASCMSSASSHAWIPLTPTSGTIPAMTTSSSTVPIPLSASGQVTGTFETNVCLITQGAVPATNITVPVSVSIVAGTLVQPTGYLTNLHPSSIAATLEQNDSSSVPFTFTFGNTSQSQFGYLVYVSDDASCTSSSSSHAWIPLTPTSGTIPAMTTSSSTVPIPLNTTGLEFGTYATNVCLITQSALLETKIAIPVKIKSVATDDIFLDGFD